MTARFERLSRAEQHMAALPVLLAARSAVVLAGERDVIDAIQQAGQAGLSCHWARQLLLSVVSSPTLQQWQADPAVRQSDRTPLDRAISLARRACGHRGGWRVSEAA